jgi:hypothetical protein
LAARGACEDSDVRRHLKAADGMLAQLPTTPLIECSDCGRVGLPELIAVHRYPG